MSIYNNIVYSQAKYGALGFPSYGPYNLPTNLPSQLGGIDGSGSLKLLGIRETNNQWYPILAGGRYAVSDESSFRYLFVSPQSLTNTITSGFNINSWTLPSSLFSQSALGYSPINLTNSGQTLSYLENTVRWCIPVPSGNAVSGSGFLDNIYISSSSGTILDTLPPNTLLWWAPTFGSEVLYVHRSRNGRSFDVLADEDSQLHEVTYPDDLTNDRVYVHDKESGIVFGLYPVASLPPPPYSSGVFPTTYVTLAFSSEGGNEPSGCSTYNTSFWQTYKTNNLSFYNQYDPDFSRNPYWFNPLRCEEIGFVDTDGLIRLRHTNVAATGDFSGSFAPVVRFISPDGPIVCTTSTVSGNVIDALYPDPSNNNVLSRLPYGTTVAISYYVKDSYCLSSLAGGPKNTEGKVIANIWSLTSVSGSATLTYETEFRKGSIPNGAPNLNPITAQIGSGFLYLQDSLSSISVPIASYAKLELSTYNPMYDLDTNTEELILGKVILYDNDGIEISNAPVSITFSNNNYNIVNMSPSIGTTAQDGTLLVRLQKNVSTTAGTIIYIADARNNTVLTQATISPSVLGGSTQTWLPSIFISLGENYRFLNTSTNRNIVRVSVLQSDGFPWNINSPTVLPSTNNSTNYPGILVLESSLSSFYSASYLDDFSLGSKVRVQLGGSNPLVTDSGILTVGYNKVPGDVLLATFYVGDSMYQSFPKVIK